MNMTSSIHGWRGKVSREIMSLKIPPSVWKGKSKVALTVDILLDLKTMSNSDLFKLQGQNIKGKEIVKPKVQGRKGEKIRT